MEVFFNVSSVRLANLLLKIHHTKFEWLHVIVALAREKTTGICGVTLD